MLKKLKVVLQNPKVESWYGKNLEKTKQVDTLEYLETAIKNREITAKEALAIAFLTGFQWNEKFEGVS
jgi:hypothetical protein